MVDQAGSSQGLAPQPPTVSMQSVSLKPPALDLSDHFSLAKTWRMLKQRWNAYAAVSGLLKMPEEYQVGMLISAASDQTLIRGRRYKHTNLVLFGHFQQSAYCCVGIPPLFQHSPGLKLQLTRSKRWALSSIVKVKGFLAALVNCSIFRQISFEDEIAGCSSVYLKLDKTIAAHRHCLKYLSAWRCRYHFLDFFFCLVFRTNVSYCKNFHLALLEAAAVDVVSAQLVNSQSRVTAAGWRLVPANFSKSARFTNC